MILHVLIAILVGWLQRHQQQVITYLQEENCILKVQLGDRWRRLTNIDRRRLAALAHPLGHKRLTLPIYEFDLCSCGSLANPL
jgi:hypothetical protein